MFNNTDEDDKKRPMADDGTTNPDGTKKPPVR